MDNKFDNPFADYGNIVYGARFIGRNDDKKVIEDRIIHPNEAGNLAIIGKPRIGKSSLIFNTIMTRESELIAENLLPIWINLATYDQTSHFFRSLVNTSAKKLDELKWMNKSIRDSASCVFNDKQSQNEEYTYIQRFFENVRKSGYRIIFILDEFDHARHLFKGDISSFQKLRELSYRPEWRVNFVTMSRRSIQEIELQTQAISTFDGIFHKHYLSMFNEDDMEQYYKRLRSTGLTLSHFDEERITFFSGGHPFLLEIIGYELVEIFRKKQKVDVDEAALYVEHSYIDYYDHVLKLLREDGSLNKLLQILFGPVIDVKQTDVNIFLKYGLIKLNSNNIYIGFSEHFHSFLNLVQRDVDLWPIFSKTEKSLRHLITTSMSSQYGFDWIAELEKSHPKLKTIFDNCREVQRKEEKSFGSRSSNNLIEFTYPQDLFTIIFAEWNNVFNKIFGKDKNYWDQRKQLLSKIRNPLAHNRDKILEEHERKISEGYCIEILSIIDEIKWE